MAIRPDLVFVRFGRRRRGLATLATVLVVVPMIALGSGAVHAEDPVVARSGSITLTESTVQSLIGEADAETRAQLLEDPALLGQFLRSRVARMAILAEAKSKKWDQKPDVAARLEQAKSDVIVDTYIAAAAKPDANFPSDADVLAAYEANRSKLMIPRQYRLAQIFIAVPAGATKATDDEVRKRMDDLHGQLQRGKADFADLARRYSEEKATAAKGGELEWVAEDRMLPQVRQAVSGLENGGISDPIRAPDGWHLLKLLDTKAATVAPLPEVRAQLVEALRQQKLRENANAFLVEFLRQNPVQLDEIKLSKFVKK